MNKNIDFGALGPDWLPHGIQWAGSLWTLSVMCWVNVGFDIG